MNAAARMFNQGVLSRGWVVSVMLSRTQVFFLALTACALLSALSIVYVTNTTRSLNASIQKVVEQRNRLHVEWGQLLLEKSTWLMQGRIQMVAEGQLNMVLPENKSVVVINE